MRESRKPELVGIRTWAVDGFPNHVAFYRTIEGGIEVIRVLHGARDIDRILGEG